MRRTRAALCSAVAAFAQPGAASTPDAAFTLLRQTVGLTSVDVALKGGAVAKLELPRSQDALLDLYIEHARDFGDMSPYFGVIWPSALALSRHLDTTQIAEGSDVLELGSGVGLCGIAAALSCAPRSVSLSDIDPMAVELSRRSAEKSGVARLCESQVRDWNDLDSWPTAAFDVALGADIIYEAEACDAVAAVLARALRPGGHFWLADGKSRRNRALLWEGLLHGGVFRQDGEEQWVSVSSHDGLPPEDRQQAAAEEAIMQPVVLARFVRSDVPYDASAAQRPRGVC